jgi:hypothetical protein
MLARLVQDEAGLVSPEYALLLALLAVVALGTWIARGAPTRQPVAAATNGWPSG